MYIRKIRIFCICFTACVTGDRVGEGSIVYTQCHDPCAVIWWGNQWSHQEDGDHHTAHGGRVYSGTKLWQHRPWAAGDWNSVHSGNWTKLSEFFYQISIHQQVQHTFGKHTLSLIMVCIFSGTWYNRWS